jgi:hypothetical protein
VISGDWSSVLIDGYLDGRMEELTVGWWKDKYGCRLALSVR